MADFSALDFGGTPMMQMAELGKAQGQSQLVQAQAKEAQLNLQQRQQIIQLMKQAAVGAGQNPDSIPLYGGAQDMGNSLMFMANIRGQVGDFKGMAEMAEQASLFNLRKAEAQHQQISTMEAGYKIEGEKIKLYSTLLNRITDQKSLDESNTMYSMTHGGQPSPLAGRKFDDPDTKKEVARMQKTLLTRKEQMDEDIKERRLKLDRERFDDMEQHHRIQEDIALSREPMIEEHLKSLGKHGGKIVGAPSKGQVDSAYLKIKEAFPDVSGTEKLARARSLAARAMALKTASPGMDDETAQRIALQRMSHTPGVTYQSGKDKNDPLPIPSDGEFEVGKYYHSEKGVGKFTGKGFELVTPGIEEEPEPQEETQSDSE